MKARTTFVVLDLFSDLPSRCASDNAELIQTPPIYSTPFGVVLYTSVLLLNNPCGHPGWGPVNFQMRYYEAEICIHGSCRTAELNAMFRILYVLLSGHDHPPLHYGYAKSRDGHLYFGTTYLVHTERLTLLRRMGA